METPIFVGIPFYCGGGWGVAKWLSFGQEVTFSGWILGRAYIGGRSGQGFGFFSFTGEGDDDKG